MPHGEALMGPFAPLLLKVGMRMLGMEPGCLGSRPWLPLWACVVSQLLSDKAGAVRPAVMRTSLERL